MAQIIAVGKFLIDNWQALVTALVASFGALSVAASALASIALMIPGEQPEKALKGIGDFFHGASDFLAKFSKKPADPVVEDKPPGA